MTIRIPLHLFYLAVLGPVLANWLYQLLCATWELIAENRKKKLTLLNPWDTIPLSRGLEPIRVRTQFISAL